MLGNTHTHKISFSYISILGYILYIRGVPTKAIAILENLSTNITGDSHVIGNKNITEIMLKKPTYQLRIVNELFLTSTLSHKGTQTHEQLDNS